MSLNKQAKRQARKRKKRLAVAAVITGGLLICCLLGAVLYKGFASHPSQQKSTTPKSMSEKLSASNPLRGTVLFVDPNSNAAQQATTWRASQPHQAAAMDRLAALPIAKWLTSTESLASLDTYLADAKAAKAVPVLVAYNLPLRDCGRYSAGGTRAAADYQAFISTLAARIGGTRVIIILEPDALAGIENYNDQGRACLSDEQRTMYYTLLQDAVVRLKVQAGTTVYIDAGNSAWIQDTTKIAARLQSAGIANADGFSLNISNFQPTDDTTKYGQAIADKLDGKHFIIDTSRNGLGAYVNTTYPDYTWCNPPGRSLGHFPTTATGKPLVDAYLYIKYPGESDGQDSETNKCFGGPKAGTWWPEYALGLIKQWPQDLQPR